MEDFEAQIENLKQHLCDASRQNWLFGAGISFGANIPLMYPLTERVIKIITDSGLKVNISILADLESEIVEGSHIEHYLSHLGDLIAIAERSKEQTAILSGTVYALKDLRQIYRVIIAAIGETVRYGYKKNKDEEVIGDAENPIVEIADHENFVDALFSNRSNLENRTRITFFTTNYDTLLEDALALSKRKVVDGFSGGAVGFWNPEKEFLQNISDTNMCLLYKLHGSIDWHRHSNSGLMRVRYGTKYLSGSSDIMIYPQATKYVETQKDPFSYLFTGLRSTLNLPTQNVLVTCGYSFGDEHINSEIENCMNRDDNHTTLIAFTEEAPKDTIVINETLDRWLNNSKFGKRIFVAGKKGLYHNSLEPLLPEGKDSLDWWMFNGLTKFLKEGEL